MPVRVFFERRSENEQNTGYTWGGLKKSTSWSDAVDKATSYILVETIFVNNAGQRLLQQIPKADLDSVTPVAYATSAYHSSAYVWYINNGVTLTTITPSAAFNGNPTSVTQEFFYD